MNFEIKTERFCEKGAPPYERIVAREGNIQKPFP